VHVQRDTVGRHPRADLKLSASDASSRLGDFAVTQFLYGIVTFHLSYLLAPSPAGSVRNRTAERRQGCIAPPTA
jgi:hypothetical protein